MQLLHQDMFDVINLGPSLMRSRKQNMWFRKGGEPINGWRTFFMKYNFIEYHWNGIEVS